DQSFGLEHALWFADGPEDAHEEPTFRRSRAHSYVAREVRAVREAVGCIEIANFAKHRFCGPAARPFLDRLLAGRLPKPGRLSLTPMLTPKGKLYGDLTVACLDEGGDEGQFLLFGSGAMQEAHRRWFEAQLPEEGVRYETLSDSLYGIALSGPRSRELLARICRDDVSAQALRFRDIRRIFVAGVPAVLARISFSGELGYEIYVAPPYLLRLAEAVEEAGSDLGLRWYGARALMSLRLEKGWGAWTLDYRPDFTAAESGLDAFIAWDKDFTGKAAAVTERGNGPARRLVTLTIETSDIDVCNDEAILHGGEAVGYVSSGGYAHHVGRSMALGYVPTELAGDGQALEVEINGTLYPAAIQGQPLYDPAGARMRA
ncbi:MAG TPA: aminomethyl transferase family protein, partial [Kiloniellaceae bacterium]|nr:aminomethyl transferase family protein [Kiloniellaceae bacterium]